MSTDRCKHGVEMSAICDQCDDERAEQGEGTPAAPNDSVFRAIIFELISQRGQAELKAVGLRRQGDLDGWREWMARAAGVGQAVEIVNIMSQCDPPATGDLSHGASPLARRNG